MRPRWVLVGGRAPNPRRCASSFYNVAADADSAEHRSAAHDDESPARATLSYALSRSLTLDRRRHAKIITTFRKTSCRPSSSVRRVQPRAQHVLCRELARRSSFCAGDPSEFSVVFFFFFFLIHFPHIIFHRRNGLRFALETERYVILYCYRCNPSRQSSSFDRTTDRTSE